MLKSRMLLVKFGLLTAILDCWQPSLIVGTILGFWKTSWIFQGFFNQIVLFVWTVKMMHSYITLHLHGKNSFWFPSHSHNKLKEQFNTALIKVKRYLKDLQKQCFNKRVLNIDIFTDVFLYLWMLKPNEIFY